MSCALGKVGKPRMALKNELLMAIQHVFTARTCLYCYQQIWQIHMYEFYHLYSCLASTLERQKRHIAIMDLQAVSTWCSCTLQLYILLNISPCYLQVQPTYLELCRECSRTARTCTNNGYHVLLSNFC